MINTVTINGQTSKFTADDFKHKITEAMNKLDKSLHSEFLKNLSTVIAQRIEQIKSGNPSQKQLSLNDNSNLTKIAETGREYYINAQEGGPKIDSQPEVKFLLETEPTPYKEPVTPHFGTSSYSIPSCVKLTEE